MKTRIAQLSAIIILAGFYSSGLQPNQAISPAAKTENRYSFTLEEGLEMVNQLLKAVNPSLPENSYFPKWIREGINTIFEGDADNTLVITYSDPVWNSSRDSKEVMVSNYLTLEEANRARSDRKNYRLRPGHKYLPTVGIKAGRLMVLVRVQQKAKTGFSQMMKDTFAVFLAHEAEHLKRGEGWFTQKRTEEERIQEESRAWLITTQEGTRPLLARGRELELDLRQAEEILRRCKDDPSCPEFRSFIKGKL